MTTLPMLLSLAEELDKLQTKFYNNDSGLSVPAIRPYNYHHALSLMATPHNLPRRVPDEKNQTHSKIDKDGFQVCMDMKHFKPNELTVKTKDSSIVVEGKHEERSDEHSFVSRNFIRRYELPLGYDANQIVSTLSSDGVLTVKVSPPPPPPSSSKSDVVNDRVIEIQQTGPAHLSNKENPKNEKEKEKQK